ncbi:chemotaxis protein CheW [Anaeromyxobacter paludicola]|uniref:CheW-like domain-containing protein n=1 Tax=Anaeromyxobacter paludicola TaxID=2918171 RepID=A0ABM7XAG1_9BACT|nr:chemotaxis protein CheW [Anaeromyxobacter paludicola]BDG08805.1 hypothetical protein AMPC_19180 [Anaeromyxobacter paludicola]
MTEERQVLLVRAGGRVCALPVGDVVETSRPAAVSPLAGTPDCVAGTALLRGAAAPVISLGHLLTGEPPPPPARWVSLRCGGALAALAVEEVLGVAALPADALARPALEQAAGGALEGTGQVGRELVFSLRAARLVPEEVWRALSGAGRAR